MRKLWFAFAFSVVSTMAGAVSIKEITYNRKTDSLIALVRYEGGCLEHQFRVRLTNCKWRDFGDVKVCEGLIEDISAKEDRCPAAIYRHIEFNLDRIDAKLRPLDIHFSLESRSQVISIPKAR